MTDPIDRRHLAEMTGDDDEFARELIAEFIKSTDDLLNQLGPAIEGGDAEAVRIASHAIKGSALSVGAMEIGEITKGMEDLASEGDLSRMQEDLAAVVAVFDVIKEQNPG